MDRSNIQSPIDCHILDNGGYTFLAKISYENIKIYRQRFTDENDYDTFEYDIHEYTINHFRRVWLGKIPNTESTGHSVLVHLYDDQYVYIGPCTFQFTIDDTVLDYIDPILRSGCVSCPFVLCKNTVISLYDTTQSDWSSLSKKYSREQYQELHDEYFDKQRLHFNHTIIVPR